ncbi:MAG: polyprenyl synthetase family protein [Betaproteobacteria bacterium]|nr:polyprenyl synthetase family protein [Betaproteobacteria bacterium]
MSPTTASTFLSPVADDMQQVDGLIRTRLDSDVALVRQVAEHIVAGGGKRLRPALLLLAAGALGCRGAACHELAAVVEFIHTATLLHDDVVDESQLRRGRHTANAAFGNAASVLVGDFLYSRAFQMMVGLDNLRVMRVLADATNTIAEGEVLQLMNCHDPDVDEARYLDVVRRKTAKLFEAAARLGGVLAEATAPLERGLAVYGMHLGTAFQLVDDVLDYSGAAQETGKSLGDDLAEGKPTLPLIRVMQAGSAEQRALVRRAIVDGGREDFAPVLVAIQATKALDFARAAAQREADVAAHSIAGLPSSDCKDSLLELAAFAVSRRS